MSDSGPGKDILQRLETKAGGIEKEYTKGGRELGVGIISNRLVFVHHETRTPSDKQGGNRVGVHAFLQIPGSTLLKVGQESAI